MTRVEEIIRELGLEPLPVEGGYYRETYRSQATLSGLMLPPLYPRRQAVAGDVYLLLAHNRHVLRDAPPAYRRNLSRLSGRPGSHASASCRRIRTRGRARDEPSARTLASAHRAGWYLARVARRAGSRVCFAGYDDESRLRLCRLRARVTGRPNRSLSRARDAHQEIDPGAMRIRTSGRFLIPVSREFRPGCAHEDASQKSPPLPPLRKGGKENRRAAATYALSQGGQREPASGRSIPPFAKGKGTGARPHHSPFRKEGKGNRRAPASYPQGEGEWKTASGLIIFPPLRRGGGGVAGVRNASENRSSVLRTSPDSPVRPRRMPARVGASPGDPTASLVVRRIVGRREIGC